MRLPYALRSLAHRNVRLFLAGQAVSLLGTWMQSVAMSWLVYRLTRSAEMLGLVAFLSQLPAFLFSPWAGSLADRLPRRRIVQLTQANSLVQAVLLATLTFSGQVRPWHLLVLAFQLGLSYAFEIPARNALVADMAGRDTANATALNSTVVNLARVVGPTLAGLLVARVGEAWCFALNAATFLATLTALQRLRLPPERAPTLSGRGTWHHLAEGLAYTRHTPWVQRVLLLCFTGAFFALPYQSLLPLVAAEVLGGGPALLGQLFAGAGVGALGGAALLLLRRGEGGLARRAGVGALLLGGSLVGLALARSPLWATAALTVTGLGFITQFTGTLTLLQSRTPPPLRGRVIGLYSMLFVGVTPFGALLAGQVAARLGASLTVGLGGAFLVGAGLLFLRHLAEPPLPHPPEEVAARGRQVTATEA